MKAAFSEVTMPEELELGGREGERETGKTVKEFLCPSRNFHSRRTRARSLENSPGSTRETPIFSQGPRETKEITRYFSNIHQPSLSARLRAIAGCAISREEAWQIYRNDGQHSAAPAGENIRKANLQGRTLPV